MPFDPFGDYATKGYLRNRLAERDIARVRKLEHVGFSGRVLSTLLYLIAQPFLTYEHLLETHRMLFGFLYPWAGEDRMTNAPTLSIGRGTYKDLFARPEVIRLACESAINMTAKELTAQPGLAFARLAYAHPFLDMNGRTILTFHSAMIRRVHMYVRWDCVAKPQFLDILTKDVLEEGGALDKLIEPCVHLGRKRPKTLARIIDEATTKPKS